MGIFVARGGSVFRNSKAKYRWHLYVSKAMLAANDIKKRNDGPF